MSAAIIGLPETNVGQIWEVEMVTGLESIIKVRDRMEEIKAMRLLHLQDNNVRVVVVLRARR